MDEGYSGCSLPGAEELLVGYLSALSLDDSRLLATGWYQSIFFRVKMALWLRSSNILRQWDSPPERPSGRGPMLASLLTRLSWILNLESQTILTVRGSLVTHYDSCLSRLTRGREMCQLYVSRSGKPEGVEKGGCGNGCVRVYIWWYRLVVSFGVTTPPTPSRSSWER